MTLISLLEHASFSWCECVLQGLSKSECCLTTWTRRVWTSYCINQTLPTCRLSKAYDIKLCWTQSISVCQASYMYVHSIVKRIINLCLAKSSSDTTTRNYINYNEYSENTAGKKLPFNVFLKIVYADTYNYIYIYFTR